VLFQRRVTLAVDVVAQTFDNRLLQLLQTSAVLRRIVGQGEGEVDAAATELRAGDDVRGEGDVVLEGLVDLGLAQADEAQGDRGARQAGAEALRQVGDEFVLHHGL